MYDPIKNDDATVGCYQICEDIFKFMSEFKLELELNRFGLILEFPTCLIITIVHGNLKLTLSHVVYKTSLFMCKILVPLISIVCQWGQHFSAACPWSFGKSKHLNRCRGRNLLNKLDFFVYIRSPLMRRFGECLNPFPMVMNIGSMEILGELYICVLIRPFTIS